MPPGCGPEVPLRSTPDTVLSLPAAILSRLKLTKRSRQRAGRRSREGQRMTHTQLEKLRRSRRSPPRCRRQTRNFGASGGDRGESALASQSTGCLFCAALVMPVSSSAHGALSALGWWLTHGLDSQTAGQRRSAILCAARAGGSGPSRQQARVHSHSRARTLCAGADRAAYCFVGQLAAFWRTDVSPFPVLSSEDAARAYDAAARQLRGPSAKTNFSDEIDTVRRCSAAHVCFSFSCAFEP